MEYAVRGPIVTRALEIEKELARGVQKPFKNVIKANLGDAHAMGQKSITFNRQLLTCVVNPFMMEKGLFAKDVLDHARALLDACGGKCCGSYSQSPGIELIRKHVAEFIQARDGGIPCSFENVILSSGASDSIRNVLKMFVQPATERKSGVMVPIPQYPLYSATIQEYDLGQVLTRENIETIIKFAHRHRLFLMADEVYQDNIYAPGSKFYSFKKVMTEMGEPYNKMELASFHSISKGFMGECGLRSGYVEFFNLDPEVFLQYKKMISAKLCPSVLGQCVLDALVNPPKPGDPSYDVWLKERTATLDSLRERATLVKQAYASIDGITCNDVQGAMYAFPRIDLPPRAIEKAKSLKQKPDFFYAKELLENTGICVVAGSGFGQKKGTYHFRTTILPQTDLMRDMLERFKAFHTKFMAEYK
ncbi:unnamed protein product [Nippostrongylus brasiliensis]|uniref:alanine transaminase n=1 Tax=Nippostrongylus brasiliensis TaxID=27835 RepID=A0A0N4YRY0_NIPBR|nr:unnamed protein product [Nippostrongylus brasiliensis]